MEWCYHSMMKGWPIIMCSSPRNMNRTSDLSSDHCHVNGPVLGSVLLMGLSLKLQGMASSYWWGLIRCVQCCAFSLVKYKPRPAIDHELAICLCNPSDGISVMCQLHSTSFPTRIRENKRGKWSCHSLDFRNQDRLCFWEMVGVGFGLVGVFLGVGRVAWSFFEGGVFWFLWGFFLEKMVFLFYSFLKFLTRNWSKSRKYAWTIKWSFSFL